jgi:hypothetical protein
LAIRVALNKLEKWPFRDYETAFCSSLAVTVLQNKIFKDLAKNALPVQKTFGIPKYC